MKKLFAVSLLAVALPVFAQQGVTLQGPEYDAYQAAENQQDPGAKAASLETFLNTYPNTQVKNAVLEEMMLNYAQAKQPDKALSAADRLLQADPNNLAALATEAQLNFQGGAASNPPDTAKLNKASDAAKKAMSVSKPAAMPDAQYAATKMALQDIIGKVALVNKDYDAAIAAFKAVLDATPADQQGKPGMGLQDTFGLGDAYAAKGDALTAAYYYARVNSFVPSYAPALQKAQYWYKKYHGNTDGYDAFKAQAAQAPNPPATLAQTVTAAPKPADIANQTVTSTTDYTTLNIGDIIFILQNASQDNADKVMAALKGKTSEFQGVVITATADTVQLAVADDNQASKTADTTIKMAEPLKAVPTVGSTQTYVATYDSYTRTPTFSLNAVDGKEPAPAKAPVKHTPARRR